MRKFLAIFVVLFGFTFLPNVKPTHAAYPAPWPDAGSADVNTGWTAYTLLGTAIADRPSATDNSTGGTTPTQSADFISGGLPTLYIAYRPVDQVLCIRVRLANTPLTPTPDGASNDDPFDNVTWSMLLDVDGDGFKEFVVQLNGDLGGPSNPIDDISVYYDNARSQALPSGAVPIFAINSAIFPDSDARATIFDFGRSRGIVSPTPGQGHFLDFQVPLSAFTVNGVQQVTASTSMSFGFGTSNSNTNPFQKDAAFNGDFTASVSLPFPFGDVYIPNTGISQNPVVQSPISVTGCNPAQISATVMDALDITGGVVTTTIADVKFYYQPDFDSDGVPDAGSTPTLIGTATSPSTSDVTFWTMTWNNGTLSNGRYLVHAVATDRQGNTGQSTLQPYDLTCGGVAVRGNVYNDINRNGQLDGTETGTGVTSLWVKLKPAAGANATRAVAVDPTTGAYEFTGVSAGTYSLILDNNNTLTDVTPFLPAGYVGTQAANQQIDNVVIATSTVTTQNFGLFAGSRITGVVFADTGTGGGIANNGVREGGEVGIAGVQVQLTDAAGTTVHGTATTDGSGNYTLFVPSSVGATTLRVVETNAGTYLSTGGTVGNTGGTYSRATDAVTFTNTVGASYANINFGDVPLNQFTNDGAQNGVPGGAVLYPHVYTAGTAGSVTFTTTNLASPANTGWQHVLYLDANGNGALDAGENPITGTITVTAGQQVSLLVKQFVPANAPLGSRNSVTISAQFTYTNASPALSSTLTRNDVTTVALESGLQLSKAVDKTTARSGDLITYTITYRNISGEALGSIIINDTTPAFTVFISQSNGALPASLTGVTATTPAVNAFGALRWTFTGTLAPNQSGTVSFVVRLR